MTNWVFAFLLAAAVWVATVIDKHEDDDWGGWS